MTTTATFLGPVDELPPEGDERSPSTSTAVDYCASLFTDSSLLIEVSRDGATVLSNPHEKEIFQEFDLDLPEDGAPELRWKDKAFDIHLQGLFRDRSAFSTLSDASEPEDYVRRFLEVLGSSLDEPVFEHDGATLPLIRWQAGDDGESAQIQLLGVLLADDDQFERFCQAGDSDLGLIFEDAEIEAHGVRETLTVMALLGVTLGSTVSAEAGLFANLKKKKEMREQARQQQIVEQQAIQQRQAAIQAARQSGWLDVHNDAYFNYQVLESNKDGDRKVIVDISAQRAYLLVDGVVAIDTAISTARSGKVTPRGEFEITQRVAEGKTSTIYGCDLPFWQRLDDTAIGMHTGDLPGYPASAGCIRLPHSVAPVMFANTTSGMTVEVVDAWDQQEIQQTGQREILVAQVVQQRSDS